MKSEPLFFSSVITAILLSATCSQAVDTPITGNLSVTGWGKFNDGIDIGLYGETGINWLGGKTTAFDIIEGQGVFLWRDTIVASPLSSKNKMQLNGENSLTLYKSDGSAGIVIAPESGKITLPTGTNSGIYFGTNTTPTLKAATNGAAIFSSKVLFENGADFGSGNTLNSSNVQYLKSTLKNLGYSETTSNATTVSSIKSSGNVVINKMVGSGNFFYAVGYFYGQASIGSVGLSTYGSNAAGFLAKCSPDGSVIWATQITSSSGYCSPTAVAVNSGGAIAITGSYTGVTNCFGGGKEITASQTDGFIAVYNSSGVAQWARTFGGNDYDSLQSVAIGSDGSLAAGGSFGGTITSQGATHLSSAGGNDAAVIRYSPSGSVLWAKAIGGTDYDGISSVTMGPSGNVTASGTFSSAITTLGVNCNSAGYRDGFLVQLNGSTGQAIWAKALGGAADGGMGGHVEDSTGNIICYGTFSGTTTNLETGKNLSSSGGTNDSDAFVVKTNSSGVTQWSKALGSPSGWNYIAGAVLTNDQKIVVAGLFSGTTTNFGTGMNLSSVDSTNAIFIAQMDPSTGNITKSQAVGKSGASPSYLASESASGTLYLGGSTAKNFALGNTWMVPESFNAGWQGFDVITPASSASTNFSWSGGQASGSGSIAVGNQAFSSGTYSSAFGNSAATGDNAFAAGSGTAKGMGAVAIGENSKAMGNNSLALGANAYAGGTGSLALGDQNYIAGSYSAGIGAWNSVFGSDSFAIGEGNQINTLGGSYVFGGWNNLNSIALGGTIIGCWNGNHGNTGEYAMVFGADSTAIGNYSLALGMSLVTNSYMSTAIGSGNIGSGNPTSWVETDPLFEAGNAMWGAWDTPENKSNAITTLKNGQTTLTNKAWKANNAVPPTSTNSNGEALVVEGHSVLKGNTALQGNVTVNNQTLPDWLSSAGFLKQANVDAKGYLTSASAATAGFLTQANVDAKGYQTAAQVNTAITTKGYLTSATAATDGFLKQANVDAKGYLTTSGLSAELTSRNVVTVSNIGAALTSANTAQIELGNTTIQGKTVLNGQVTIAVPQGDISMGIYGN